LIDQILHRGCSPIGLDIGQSSIKMLQFVRDGDGVAALASGQFSLPTDLPTDGDERRAALVQGIGQLLDSSAFHGRRAVAGLPDSRVQYKNMRLPKMPPDERAEAVKWEATDRFELDDEAAVDYLDAGEVRQGDQVRDELILMAVNGRDLREQTEIMLAAGLKPIAIEPSPISMSRSISRLYRRESDQHEVRVLVDFGLRSTRVVVMRGSRVLFYKPIDIGGLALTQAVADHLELTTADAEELRHKLHDSDASQTQEGEPLFGSTRRENVSRAVLDSIRPIVIELANEIGLCLRYYSVTFRGSRPDTINLIGGQAYDKDAAKLIGQKLEMKTQVLNPLEGICLAGDRVSLDRRSEQAEWAVAAGLALRNMPVGLRMRGAA
jgi:type IV pilus assembly protein PilM